MNVKGYQRVQRLVWMRSCRFFVRREGVLGIGHLVVFLFNQCITCSLMEVAEKKENTYEKKTLFEPIG